MKKQTRSLWFLGTLVLLVGLVSSSARLNAQQSSPPPDQPSAQQQQQPPDKAAPPAPDTQTQADSSTVFNGTIVKTGDKFVLQDTSGKSYDLDRQDIAKQYEGKQVKVKGTLDADGKTIHVK